MTLAFKCFLVFALVYSVDSAKILGLFPHSGKSHYDVFEPLLLRLAERGHQMTVVSFFPPDEPPPGWKQIYMGDYQPFKKGAVDLNIFSVNSVLEKRLKQLSEIFLLGGFALKMCEIMTGLPEVKRMVDQDEKFDIVLTEEFVSECPLGLVHILNAPVVEMQSHNLMPWTAPRFALPDNPSYIPSLFIGLSPRMDFRGRVENTIFNVFLKIAQKYYVNNNEREIIERNLGRRIPPLEEIAKNTSLLLSNTHYILNGARPLLPSVIEVAGIHIKRNRKPLDEGLLKFLEQSPDGVILFSMGSMINTSTFSVEKLKYFLNAFGRLKQKIIWKWDGETSIDIPKNVHIMNWIPQLDLLRHPNVIAFISHGGMLGTIEALHAGVPVFFVPVYGDQEGNAAVAQLNGLGVSVAYSDLTKEKVEAAIDAVLSEKLRKSAADLSAAWHDLPDPLDLATSHVEHVIKHGGRRRKSEAINLATHQLFLLDVITFLVAAMFLVIYLLYRMTIFILCKLLPRKTKLD